MFLKINTIDVLNGVFSGFTLLSFIPILLFLTITSNFYMIIIVMPIVTSLLAFFIFHRYPSKIFPGDTGTLTIGALYGTIAILTDFELLALIAIFPAALIELKSSRLFFLIFPWLVTNIK